MYRAVQRRILCSVYLAALSLILICISCRDEPSDSPVSTQPLKTETTSPVNLEDTDATATELVDENPFAGCDMCHIDIVDELAGTKHEAEGVGCIKCHGPSRSHTQDENNEVKPDMVFVREDIDMFCSGCHQCSRPPATAPSTKPLSAQMVCTDCHGVHKIRRTANNN
jgi:hypothetical protein